MKSLCGHKHLNVLVIPGWQTSLKFAFSEASVGCCQDKISFCSKGDVNNSMASNIEQHNGSHWVILDRRAPLGYAKHEVSIYTNPSNFSNSLESWRVAEIGKISLLLLHHVKHDKHGVSLHAGHRGWSAIIEHIRSTSKSLSTCKSRQMSSGKLTAGLHHSSSQDR